jgi:hypothetical protein
MYASIRADIHCRTLPKHQVTPAVRPMPDLPAYQCQSKGLKEHIDVPALSTASLSYTETTLAMKIWLLPSPLRGYNPQ